MDDLTYYSSLKELRKALDAAYAAVRQEGVRATTEYLCDAFDAALEAIESGENLVDASKKADYASYEAAEFGEIHDFNALSAVAAAAAARVHGSQVDPRSFGVPYAERDEHLVQAERLVRIARQGAAAAIAIANLQLLSASRLFHRAPHDGVRGELPWSSPN